MLKLYFIKGTDGWDEVDPYLVLAKTKKDAEMLFAQKKYAHQWTYKQETKKYGKAGKSIKLTEGLIWGQFNAG